MQYHHIEEGTFVSRPNRFIAWVKRDNSTLLPDGTTGTDCEVVHVKNTGRCGEILLPGTRVYLEKSDAPGRKTQYDLVAARKGDLLINIDSQAPNRAVEEWLWKKELFPDLMGVRPETVYGNSRFDFYVETEKEKIFLEVKGVTLEKDGEVSFPDAPSLRAIKHLEELVAARKEGYQAYVLFVVQMENARFFSPNWERHPEFAKSLVKAAAGGVRILAYSCHVKADSMEIASPVPVFLFGGGFDGRDDNQSYNSSSQADHGSQGNQANRVRGDVVADNFGSSSVRSSGSRSGESADSGEERECRYGRLELLAEPLLQWYDRERRILPWREDPTPYHVWVSEIMLQQTRVEAVKSYYERFMKKLPDLASLAEAPREELLKLWEGLGYYNRVRNMQNAAKQVMEQFKGRMPEHYGELLTLKGIGSYTAGAIASIAFGEKVPAVDGNVLRVLSRLRADERRINDGRIKSEVEQELGLAMPDDRPGDFNQAMMELGACVCIPNGTPRCNLCPVADLCLAKSQGRQTCFPYKNAGRKRTVEEKTILLIRWKNLVALRRRQERGLLAGLYEFPSIEGMVSAGEAAGYLEEREIPVREVETLEKAKHIFTHREWHMQGYLIRTATADEDIPENRKDIKSSQEQERPAWAPDDWIFVDWQTRRDRYPLPSAFAVYEKYMEG